MSAKYMGETTSELASKYLRTMVACDNSFLMVLASAPAVSEFAEAIVDVFAKIATVAFVLEWTPGQQALVMIIPEGSVQGLRDIPKVVFPLGATLPVLAWASDPWPDSLIGWLRDCLRPTESDRALSALFYGRSNEALQN